jgi:hypothetical protein
VTLLLLDDCLKYFNLLSNYPLEFLFGILLLLTLILDVQEGEGHWLLGYQENRIKHMKNQVFLLC